MTDVWRVRNPEAKKYTYMRSKPKFIGRRLDYVLTSMGTSDRIEDIWYIPGILTDHSGIYTCLATNVNQRGHGFWKLNCSHLKRIDFLEYMKEKIAMIETQAKEMNPIKKWEYLKLKIRDYAQSFAKTQANDLNALISMLSEKITELENKDIMDENALLLLENTKVDLDELMFEKAKSIMFRSKCNWYEYEGKSSSYFYGLEKAKYNAKTCSSLIDEQGNVVKNDKDILSLQQTFYTNLYKRDVTVDFNFVNNTDIRVTKDMYEMQNSEISYEEVANAVLQLKNGKCPGSDGIPVDFYKVFWSKLAGHFMDMLKYAYDNRCLPDTTMMGIINLIPKASKDMRLLKNLRPITLLNSDYKIVEKIMANRLIPALNSLISPDQRGFLKNRRIATNIRKIFDIITYADQNEIQSLILSLDFEKCFDKIEYTAIFGAMNFFGIAERIQDWIHILYEGFSARIQNNGKFSNKIDIERSVHQGGPNSVYLFLLCAELLAINIKENKEIKGIMCNEIMNVLNQYADDADIFLLYDQQTIDSTISVLSNFKENTGFTVNYDKTQLYRIGSIKNSNAKLYTEMNLNWTSKPVNVLGVWISHNSEEVIHMNYASILDKFGTILSSWCNRNLSLKAKVGVINTLGASMFVYKMTVLPPIPDNLIKAFEKQCNRFLWNGARPKIPLRTVASKHSFWRIGTCKLKTKEKSLKITWLQILLEEPEFACMVYGWIDPVIKEDIWHCNLQEKDVCSVTTNPFWSFVLESWAKYNYSDDTPYGCLLWWNSNIRVGGKPFRLKRCYEKGLKYLSQLFPNGHAISAEAARDLYDMSQMELNALLAATPRRWKDQLRTSSIVGISNYNMLKDTNHLAGKMYKELCADPTITDQVRIKWENELGMEIDKEIFLNCFQEINIVTNVSKYRSFQYRLLHRALVMNTHLFHWGLADSQNCTFCGEAKKVICICLYIVVK